MSHGPWAVGGFVYPQCPILTEDASRLPQWEGVQRQWYYVQRATGKSQWDIPTEPVVLSPSTTPTSIGAGPSQPSTNNPQVEAAGSSLVERIESAVDNAGTSSSLSSQLNGQSSISGQVSAGTLGWHLAHNAQNASQPYTQPFTSGDGTYAAGQFPPLGHGNPNYPSYKATYAEQGQHLMQPNQQTWANGQMIQQHPSGPSVDPTMGRYRSFPIDSQQLSHISAYAPSVAYTGSQHSGFAHATILPSQPQWQLEGHETKSNHSHQPSSFQYSLSNLSQPFHGSSAISQTSGLHSGGSASRSSHPSIAPQPGNAYSGNQADTQYNRGSLSAHPHANANANAANTLPGHPLSRSQSHQTPGYQYGQQAELAAVSYSQPFSNNFGPQLSNAHGSSQNPDMLQIQPGIGFNSGDFSAGSSAHGGAQPYQNPIVQAGVRQYLPSLPQSSSQNDGNNHNGAHYHPQHGQFTAHQGQWTTPEGTSRIAASDPQFVSGPWASSTPPASGLPQSHHG
ncbi:hypothetical protein PMG11_02874 [Penicillium brasilianum]|uniref:WW domain-containing protein n=1 Tax=Penicillium brasilianum TaxID=104259 RepID=A0A0F7TJA6_PENBI|nr:hypothetical protein PMG11_02874 [Penicillium brasilianum]